MPAPDNTRTKELEHLKLEGTGGTGVGRKGVSVVPHALPRVGHWEQQCERRRLQLPTVGVEAAAVGTLEDKQSATRVQRRGGLLRLLQVCARGSS